MDEFGVLVESIGFKAHGRSAPMAKSKARPKSNPNSHFIPNINGNTSPAFNDSSSLPVDELDGIFRSGFNSNKTRKTPDFIGSDDVFGGPSHFGGSDLDSYFASSNGPKSKDNDSNSRDLFGANGPKSYGFDDLFGGFSAKEVKNGTGFDDLLPGFGDASNTPRNEALLDKKIPSGHPPRSSSTMIDDPFSVFQSPVSQSDASWPFHGSFDKDTGKGAVQTSIDDLLMGGAQSGSKVDGAGAKVKRSSSGAASNGFVVGDDLDTIFGGAHGGQRNNHASPTITTQDPLFNSLFPQAKVSVKQTSSPSSSSKTTSPAINVGDAFPSRFGDITTSSGEFVEVAGEPEERRRARLNRHMRMNAHMAEALAEKNQRDLQIQREREEKYRLSETLDGELKRWSAGKEGNLRALLSSLHQVLWPECGWRPVSLTDMITSDSVKKVYKKATLYVHPDKVQQKGANLQQRYIAEKVFDLLKEAWTKFSAEELR